MSLQRSNVQCDFGGYWNYQNAPFQFGIPSNAPQTAAMALGGGTADNPLALPVAATAAVALYLTSPSTADGNSAVYANIALSGVGGGGIAVAGVNLGIGGATGLLNVIGVQGIGGLDTTAATEPATTGVIAGVRGVLQLGAATRTITSGAVACCLDLQNNVATGNTLSAASAHIHIKETGAVKQTLLFNLDGVDTASLFYAATSTTIGYKLKILVNGTPYWIALTAAV
jgi:hypothetical protein